ncbi:MAG: hypothetical protein AAFN10_18770 [Bacteroidota bacterium]
MKKLLLTLLALPLVLTSCVEDLLDVTFDYPISAGFTMSDEVEANTLTMIESDVIEVDLVDELSDRNLNGISSVKLKSLEVKLGEDATIDWSILKSLELKMVLDGETFKMASFGANSTIDGDKINLEVSADEIRLEEFLERETVQVRLFIETNESITTEVPLEATAVISITASPIE